MVIFAVLFPSFLYREPKTSAFGRLFLPPHPTAQQERDVWLNPFFKWSCIALLRTQALHRRTGCFDPQVFYKVFLKRLLFYKSLLVWSSPNKFFKFLHITFVRSKSAELYSLKIYLKYHKLKQPCLRKSPVLYHDMKNIKMLIAMHQYSSSSSLLKLKM